jgi:drug/metabolite transporter (DMT)-like permease
MSDLFLYAATVLIWGSTWFAIKFQLGTVPPAVSVMWRFLAAAVLLLGYALIRRLPLRFSLRDHAWMLLQGLLLFCVNYVCVYLAEQYLASGLVAVVFSMLSVANIVGMRVFFGVPVYLLGLAGAVCGIAGVVLLFWPELRQFSTANGGSVGLALSLVSTLVASLGNMTATRNQRRGLPVLQVNGWSMLYGAGLMALYVALRGQPFMFDRSWPYLISWAYLTVFGTVLAFGAYLTLMSRIGADRAGYSMIAIPVVALAISTGLENLHWTAGMWTGVGLCLAGNILVLRRRALP